LVDLFECVIMHGLTNPKFKYIVFERTDCPPVIIWEHNGDELSKKITT